MKTIVSFSLLLIVGFGYFAAAEDKTSVPEVARNTSAEKNIPEQKEIPARFKIDLYPAYVAGGIPKTAPFIAGEKLIFQARVNLLESDKNENFGYTILHELYDPDGNVISQVPERRIHREVFQIGGSSFPERFWFSSEDLKPGKYRLKYLLINHESGKSEAKEIPFDIQSKDTFGALDIGICSKMEPITPIGGNVTIGEQIFLVCRMNGAGVKEDRIHLKSTLTVIDSKKQPIDREPISFDSYMPVPRYGLEHPQIYFTIWPNRPGDFILHVEIKDSITEKTTTFDVPIKVSLPPGLEEEKQ